MRTMTRLIDEIRAHMMRLSREGPSAARRELEQVLAALDAAEADRGEQLRLAQAARAYAERELDRYRTLLEHGPDGYLVTDHAGVVREANLAAAELLKVPRRYLQGKPLSLFVDERDVSAFRWRLNRLQRESTRGEWVVRLRSRDGAVFEAALTVSAFADREGLPPALRWFVRDISHQRRAEELAAAHEFLQELLSSEQKARMDAEASEGRLALLAEVSRTLAAAPDQDAIVGGLAELLVPDIADLMIADLVGDGGTDSWLIRRSARGEDLHPVRVSRPDGRPPEHPMAEVMQSGSTVLVLRMSAAWLDRWSGDPIERQTLRDLDPKAVVLIPLRAVERSCGALMLAQLRSERAFSAADVALCADIGRRTGVALDRVRLVEALASEHRHKDEFLAMLAHELRNPLAAISSAVQSLAQASSPGGAALLAILVRQTHHLGRLVGDLVEASRIRLGQVSLNRGDVDLREVAQRAMEMLDASGLSARQRVDLELPQEPVTVHGDPDRLQQIFGNLLDNAAKYTPAGGTIAFALTCEDDEAVVRVRDSGRGIAPDVLPSVFNAFVRAGDDGPGRSAGLGLGLTVVRDLVAQHRGQVIARSPGVGSGSEFEVRLPLQRRAAVAPAASASEAAPAPRRILVVEDNDDARESLRILLELKGHQVDAVATGEEGVRRALATRPDTALIDIGLPDLDGYSVAQQIRSVASGAEIFLVALTGFSRPTDRHRAEEAGFDAHAVKPVDWGALEHLLSRHR
jgi:PAS domain S-box-containing protein